MATVALLLGALLRAALLAPPGCAARGDATVWTVISPAAACEENSEGVQRTHGAGGYTLETCKAACGRGCAAIDFFQETGWCNWYAQACSTPLRRWHGASSYRKARAATQRAVMKGIAYGPAPLKRTDQYLPLDDFMGEAARPMWGERGRGDLALMQRLGVNTVRLYGNDPRQDHTGFLEEAHSRGLRVIPGLSDWPFTQMPGSCSFTGYNCFEQIKEAYVQNLRNGWLREDGTYHPALTHVIVVNELDLKLPGMHDPISFTRAAVSAIDGMLSAEEEAGLRGAPINLTVTFAFGICQACPHGVWGHHAKPGVNQMVLLHQAMMNPRVVGYSARNDLAACFRDRFTHSFNTQNPAHEMQHLFFDAYQIQFPSTPVFIGEFHATHPERDQAVELTSILRITEASSTLLGVSFFEFQVRYDKGGSEMSFGMFGLGDYSFGDMDYEGHSFPVWCLTPVHTASTAASLPNTLAAAFGGTSVDAHALCTPDPAKVPLTAPGFNEVNALRDTAQMAIFVERVVRHAGGEVIDEAAKQAFAARVTSFEAVRALGVDRNAAWASFAPSAACRADRAAGFAAARRALGQACDQTWFNCADIPAQCQGDAWREADYALSVYYSEQGIDPLTSCYYDGAGLIAGRAEEVSPCVVSRDPAATALTEEGFHAIARLEDPAAMEVFVRRVARELLRAAELDRSALGRIAAAPPASLHELEGLLEGLLEGRLREEFDRPQLNATRAQCQEGEAGCGPLSETGFGRVLASGNRSALAVFVRRVVAHFGGEVQDQDEMLADAARAASLADLVESVRSEPQWATWRAGAACAVVQGADEGMVGRSIDLACSKGTLDCRRVPLACAWDRLDRADYVLSAAYGGAGPAGCLSNGSLVFTRPRLPFDAAYSNCTVTGGGSDANLLAVWRPWAFAALGGWVLASLLGAWVRIYCGSRCERRRPLLAVSGASPRAPGASPRVPGASPRGGEDRV